MENKQHISQQLQEWSKNNIYHLDYYLEDLYEIIQQVKELEEENHKLKVFTNEQHKQLYDWNIKIKELENDKNSLQQQLSAEIKFSQDCVTKYGKQTCDLLNTRNELARLKLKSDTENSVKLEEFKKEIVEHVCSNIDCKDTIWMKDVLNETLIDRILNLADKYFGKK